ncbi:hypothetical protein M8J75_007280 [Diaphorina citri]|nr:hypothetical protein M8J75_007280 [Diaphorina citri]
MERRVEDGIEIETSQVPSPIRHLEDSKAKDWSGGCELNIITVYEPFKQLDNDAGDNIVWEEFDKRTMR